MSLSTLVGSKDADVHALARQVGQQVLIADDLFEALDIIQTKSPDLILFDHNFTPGYTKNNPIDNNQVDTQEEQNSADAD